MKSPTYVFAALTATLLLANHARAEMSELYVGIDSLNTIASGTYIGLPNPNAGRLTLLYNHGDHYHGIGAYSYTGPAGAPTINPTSTNNHLPELSTGLPGIRLTPGTGIYSGLLRSVHDPLIEYSDFHMKSTATLSGFAPGSAETILFNSSANRWNGVLSSLQPGLQLVGLSPGLKVGTSSALNVLPNIGDSVSMGGGSVADLDLVLYTNAGATPGNYSASFRFIDLNGLASASSGTFFLDVQVVPEPASLALMAGGGLLLLVRRSKCQASTVN